MNAPRIVYRCISRRRWEAGQDHGHLPDPKHWHRDYSGDPKAIPTRCSDPRCREPKVYDAARWNDEDQYAVYASHDPDTAVEEKRKHLLDGRAALGLPPLRGTAVSSRSVSKQVVVVELPALPGAVYDGRDDGHDAFDDCLGWCEYGRAREVGAQLRDEGYCHFIVPSVPAPDEWGSVWYCLGPGQPTLADLPDRSRVDASDPFVIDSTGVRPC